MRPGSAQEWGNYWTRDDLCAGGFGTIILNYIHMKNGPGQTK